MNADIINWILRTATNAYENGDGVSYGKCVFDAACRIMDISYLAGSDIDPSKDDLKVKEFLYAIMYMEEHGDDHNGKPPLREDDTIESPHRPSHSGHHRPHPSRPNRPERPKPVRPDKPSENEKPDFKPDFKPDVKPWEKPNPNDSSSESSDENPNEDTPNYGDTSYEDNPSDTPDCPNDESSNDDGSFEWGTKSRLDWLRNKRLHLEEKIRALEKAEKERTYRIQRDFFAKTIYDSTKDILVRNGVVEDEYKVELVNLYDIVKGDIHLLSEANLYKGNVIAVRKYSDNDYSVYLKFHSLETCDDQVLMTRYRNDILFPKE